MASVAAVRRPRAIRWAAPALVAAAIAVGASGVLRASADPNLPPRTAAQLLADVQTATVPAFQGTVVEKASLGLPELPQTAQTSSTAFSLLTGSHTAKIWYGGPAQQRVALIDPMGETDLFHNGTDVWQWDSQQRTASHVRVPAGSADRRQQQTLTPDQLAQQALAAIDPSTQVAVDPEQQVAGRSAYHLVLTPRDAGSKIGSVRISIDGATKLPLGVQVFARGGSSPALDVSYTSITFAQPDPSMFTFTPPAGVTVTEGSLDPGAPGAPAPAAVPGGSRPQLIGSGWTTVALVRGAALGDQARAMLSSLPAVSGAWGSGRLLDSAVLSVLITDDGRMLAGAVPPEVLYAAAAANR